MTLGAGLATVAVFVMGLFVGYVNGRLDEKHRQMRRNERG